MYPQSKAAASEGRALGGAARTGSREGGAPVPSEFRDRAGSAGPATPALTQHCQASPGLPEPQSLPGTHQERELPLASPLRPGFLEPWLSSSSPQRETCYCKDSRSRSWAFGVHRLEINQLTATLEVNTRIPTPEQCLPGMGLRQSSVRTAWLRVAVTPHVVVPIHRDGSTHPPINASSKVENTTSSCAINSHAL